MRSHHPLGSKEIKQCWFGGQRKGRCLLCAASSLPVDQEPPILLPSAQLRVENLLSESNV